MSDHFDIIPQTPIKTLCNSMWFSNNRFKETTGNDIFYINISLYSKKFVKHALTKKTAFYIRNLFERYHNIHGNNKDGLNMCILLSNNYFKTMNKRIEVKNIDIRKLNYGIVYDINLSYI